MENSLFLRDGGFDATPLAPEQAFRCAKREQSKRLFAERRRFVLRRRCIRYDVRRGEGGQTNGIGPTSALAIKLRQNSVDTEEGRGWPRRSPVGARSEERRVGKECRSRW